MVIIKVIFDMNIVVRQIINEVYSSNTYILSVAGLGCAWLIDVGDINPVRNYLLTNEFSIGGVFLTHVHYDHIYGLNALLDNFGNFPVYTTEDGMKSLYSDRLNLSLYMGTPFTYNGTHVEILNEGTSLTLIDGVDLDVYATPGHSSDCLSYRIGNYFFTGDSYIPGLPVVTMLRGGNKELAEKSVKRIKSLMTEDTILCPGHGDLVKFRK